MVKQHIIICEEEYCVQILTQILQTQPKSKPGSETRKKNPGVKSEKHGANDAGLHIQVWPQLEAFDEGVLIAPNTPEIVYKQFF